MITVQQLAARRIAASPGGAAWRPLAAPRRAQRSDNSVRCFSNAEGGECCGRMEFVRASGFLAAALGSLPPLLERALPASLLPLPQATSKSASRCPTTASMGSAYV